MCDLPDIDLTDTRFYKEAFAEGFAEGLRQAHLQENESNRLYAISCSKRFLKHSIGQLPEITEPQLDILSIQDAYALIEASMKFHSVDDLQAWLKKQRDTH